MSQVRRLQLNSTPMKAILPLSFAVALVVWASPARAEPVRRVSLTLSPLHLVHPFVELTGEVRLLPGASVAIIAGAGGIKALGARRFAFEAGGQGRFYVFGDFDRGAHVGAEVLYLRTALDEQGLAASGAGVSVGAFGGYKHTFPVGFVVEGQVGYAHTFASASARTGSQTSSATDSQGGLLLNVNLGWAF